MSACGTWGLWHSVTAPLVRPQDMRVTSVTDDTTVLLCRLLYPPPARLPRIISGASLFFYFLCECLLNAEGVHSGPAPSVVCILVDFSGY